MNGFESKTPRSKAKSGAPAAAGQAGVKMAKLSDFINWWKRDQILDSQTHARYR